ncbi:MAG TPA: carbohydrate ABC transporter permease, partial [Arthrobacter sp.]
MSIIDRAEPAAAGTSAARPDPAPARPAIFRKRIFGTGERPGFLSYGLLLAFLLSSAYPLWWSVVIGSRSNEALGETWPPLLPGGNFWTNVGEVFDTVPFWLALGNSVLISG